MTQRISDTDLAAATTTLVLGASESIIFLAREYGGSEFGLSLRDIANLADRRLSLRCLLPIPGVHQSRDGRLSQGESRIQTAPREVKATVRTFRSAGWRVRLVPETGINAFLVADAGECIFHEFSDGPLWDDEREAHHYESQFENHWKASLGVSALTSLYDREATLDNPDDASQLAIASGTAWSSLLAQLSQSPRLLHTMVRWTPPFRQPDGVNKVDSFWVMKPERRQFEHSPDCGEVWGGLGLWETGAVSGFP